MPPTQTRPLRILAVDDSPVIRAIIAAEFQGVAEVLEAGDGEEAIRIARQQRPDLVTLDIEMPGIDGYEVCEELKMYEETIGIPIVMISSLSSDEDRLHALAAGAVEYFVKPFTRGALREFVLALLQRLDANRNKTVFCVDGTRSVRGMIERLLANHGYNTRLFTNTDSLNESLRTEQCDLLLLDLSLPDRTGYEALVNLRRQPKFDTLPVISLTSSGARKDLPVAFHAGADDFIRKPFFVEELLARVDALLRRKDLEARLREEATTDALTRLYNRRELVRLLHVEANRAQRDHHPVGCLVIDLDHFKHINDTYGHPIGDEVLKVVGRELAQRVRVTDLVGRYGGEEFVVIAPKATPFGLRVLAERLRLVIEGLQVQTTKGPISFTTSIGGAVWGEQELAVSPSLEAFVKPADDALYMSKVQGRNRSTILTLDGNIVS